MLELGCGPGAAAREVARRLDGGFVLAVDRSPRAVAQAAELAAAEIAAGRMDVRQAAAEALVLEPGEEPYDLVFAVRLGALDGRQPAVGARVLERLGAATTPDARLFVDGREVQIRSARP